MSKNTPKSGKPAPNVMLNKLRASVLGANDGIVSIASLIFGVEGATNNKAAIFTAGLAGLVAGALSMGVGEYVSVSTQRDTERAYIAKEKRKLQQKPDEELEGLAGIYAAKGISAATARKVAEELSAIDPVTAHLDAELNINEDELINPMHAAVASLLSFTVGALIPLLSVVFAPAEWRIAVTLAAVTIALFMTGYFSATIGEASRRRAIFRVITGGLLAMAVTYAIGHLFGTAVS
jgi:VIT1/CCC1 family predicted Fe2+/Mn2+ transporter